MCFSAPAQFCSEQRNGLRLITCHSVKVQACMVAFDKTEGDGMHEMNS